MANPKGPGLMRRAAQAVRYTISGANTAWFGPQNPMLPQAQQAKGRLFDFPIAVNLNYQPRSNETLSFKDLKTLSETCSVLRSVIETRKDQLSSLDWIIRPRKIGTSKIHESNPDKDARVTAITNFFQKPSSVLDWAQWTRQILEQHFVLDAVSVERVRNRGGGLVALEVLDGAAITPLIDDDGKTPTALDVAYQMILKGFPAIDFSTDDLLYYPNNRRAGEIYGFPHVAQISAHINLSIKRVNEQFAAYDSANSPSGVMEGAPELTIDQISALQEYWTSILSGNIEARAQVLWVPNGSKYTEIKKDMLFDEFDEWLARVICYCFSIAPTPFIKSNNRATAQTQATTSSAEGLQPTMQYMKRLVDTFIREDFNSPDLEFSWDKSSEFDPEKQATINKDYTAAGIISIDEARGSIGKPPLGGAAATPMVLVPATGYVPIDPKEAHDLAQPPLPPGGAPGAGQPQVGGPGGKAALPAKPPQKALPAPAKDKEPAMAKGEGPFTVRRKLLTTQSVVEWAKAAGFNPPKELFLEGTVDDFTKLDSDVLLIENYHARLYKDDNAHVYLVLDSDDLADQWQDMVGRGMSFEDVPEFAPMLLIDFTGADKALPDVPLTAPLLFGEQTVEDLGKAWDTAAHDAELNPTQGQKDAGNYKMGHIKFQGLDITIENPAGGQRKGPGWKVLMPYHYGYIKGTVGADDDHVDVFVGPDEKSDRVWVIDQRDDKWGGFDEHKTILGFSSWAAAKAAYVNSFSDGKGEQRIGTVNALSMEQFKEWLAHGDTTQPCAMAKTVTQATGLTYYDQGTVPPDVKTRLKRPEHQKAWLAAYQAFVKDNVPELAKAMAYSAVRAQRAEGNRHSRVSA